MYFSPQMSDPTYWLQSTKKLCQVVIENREQRIPVPVKEVSDPDRQELIITMCSTLKNACGSVLYDLSYICEVLPRQRNKERFVFIVSSTYFL